MGLFLKLMEVYSASLLLEVGEKMENFSFISANKMIIPNRPNTHQLLTPPPHTHQRNTRTHARMQQHQRNGKVRAEGDYPASQAS